MPLLIRLALRNILRHRRRSLLTALSIAGGYLLCALSFSLVEGSYNNVITVFTESETGHIQVHKDDYLRRPRIYKTIDDPARVEAVLRQNPDVRHFAPRVHAPALSYSGEKNAPATVIGIDPDLEAVTTRLRAKLATGNWLVNSRAENGYYGALIGQGVASSLGVDVGDELVLISQGADGSIANDLYQVAGIVGSRTSPERSNIYLPLIASQEFLSLDGRVHEYAIILRDINQTIAVSATLQQALPELVVSPWQIVQETFYKAMESDKRGNLVSLGIILFIVFIGVLNTVLMSVLERTREFGVLKAIGSRPGTILTLIIAETGFLSFFSIMIGVIVTLPVLIWFNLVGIAMPEPIDMGGVEFRFLTGDLSLYVFVMPMIFVYSFALLVSIPPGIRAARVPPTEAMRSY